jgi:bifunctional DNase/RNase
MMGTADRVPVALRSIRFRSPDESAAAIVAPIDSSEGSALWIGINDREARVLAFELDGNATSRVQAIVLSSRIAEVLQGHIAASILLASSRGSLRAAVEIETPHGLIEVPTEPGHALAAASWLQIPLLADRRLFGQPCEQHPITGPLASFLSSLDLSGFDGSSQC